MSGSAALGRRGGSVIGSKCPDHCRGICDGAPQRCSALCGLLRYFGGVCAPRTDRRQICRRAVGWRQLRVDEPHPRINQAVVICFGSMAPLTGCSPRSQLPEGASADPLTPVTAAWAPRWNRSGLRRRPGALLAAGFHRAAGRREHLSRPVQPLPRLPDGRARVLGALLAFAVPREGRPASP